MGVFNMMLISDSFPLLYHCCEGEGNEKGGRTSENQIGITLK